MITRYILSHAHPPHPAGSRVPLFWAHAFDLNDAGPPSRGTAPPPFGRGLQPWEMVLLMHQSRPPYLVPPSAIPALAYSVLRGPLTLIPSFFRGWDALQPWEIFPTVVPTLPPSDRHPSTRSFALAPFPFTIRPFSLSLALYLALETSIRDFRVSP